LDKQPTGEALAHAGISLLDSHKKPIATVQTDKAGEVVWTHLPWRTFQFQVSFMGFFYSRPKITFRNSDEQLVEVTLQPRMLRGASTCTLPALDNPWDGNFS